MLLPFVYHQYFNIILGVSHHLKLLIYIIDAGLIETYVCHKIVVLEVVCAAVAALLTY